MQISILFFLPFIASYCIKEKIKIFPGIPVDTGRKLNVHKAFRRRPGRILNVLCTFVQFTFCVYGDGMGQISTNTKVIISISLTLFRIGGPKKPLTSFCPVTSTNVGISL